MDGYTKTIKLDVNVTDALKSIKKVDNEMQNVGKDFKDSFKDIAKSDTLSSELGNLIKSLKTIKEIADASGQKDSEKADAIKKEQSSKKLFDSIKKQSDELFKSISDTAKEFLDDLLKAAFSMMDEIASYDIANSNVFNKNASDLAMSYGLTGASAYGADKAAQEIGFSNFDEMIENIALVNSKQMENFNEFFDKYSNSFEVDKQQALELQEFKKDWETYKLDMSRQILEWFANNKDTIKSFMDAGLKFMSIVLDAITVIANTFSDGRNRTSSERAANISDIVNSHSSNNVTISNAFNVSGSMKADNNDLIKAGETLYRQIINAFK